MLRKGASFLASTIGTAALSPKEERAASALLDAIHGAAKNGRASVTVRRAALLRALAELDGKEGRTE